MVGTPYYLSPEIIEERLPEREHKHLPEREYKQECGNGAADAPFDIIGIAMQLHWVSWQGLRSWIRTKPSWQVRACTSPLSWYSQFGLPKLSQHRMEANPLQRERALTSCDCGCLCTCDLASSASCPAWSIPQQCFNSWWIYIYLSLWRWRWPYIYIYIVESRIGSRVAIFWVKNWSKVSSFSCFRKLFFFLQGDWDFSKKEKTKKVKIDNPPESKAGQLCCATCLDQFLT